MQLEKKKILFWMSIALLILMSWSAGTWAATTSPEPATGPSTDLAASGPATEQLVDLGQLKTLVDQVDREVRQYVPEINLSGLINGLRHGDFKLDWETILFGLLRYLFREVLANSALLGKLVVLAIICAVFQNLQSAFENGTTGKIAHTVTYLALITIAIGSFTLALNTGREVIDKMNTFMQALTPILLTLLTAMGGITSVALLHPVVFGTISILTSIIKNVFFPLIFFAAILELVNQISDQFKVSRLAGLFKQAGGLLIGFLLTVFVGVVTIQGVAGSVADSVTMRTAKFLTGTFIPVVGKMFADAVEVVASTSLFLKNGIGLLGAVVVFLLVIFPAIKILSLVFIYKLAGALVQPLGESPVGESLQVMGNTMAMVFAGVVTVAVMFFIFIAIIVGAGNMTVMLR